LIQQGQDLGRQREQIDKQLRVLTQQVEAQKDLAEAARAQSEASLQQAESAARQAAATETQTRLATEKLRIDRMTGRASALAMAALRYAERLTLEDESKGDVLPLLGRKNELRQDFDAGPEAVLETMRMRLKEAKDKLTTDRLKGVPQSKLQSMDQLLKNMRERAEALRLALEIESGDSTRSTAKLEEIEQLKVDLALGLTRDRLDEVLKILRSTAIY
jgi:hypothetical protein